MFNESLRVLMGGVHLASLISLIVKWLKKVGACKIKMSIFPNECLGGQSVFNRDAQCNNILCIKFFYCQLP